MRLLAGAVAGFLVTAALAARPAKDAAGDPLPPGALARLGTLRLRHPPAIRALAFGSAKLLVTAGRGLRAWAIPSGKAVQRGDRDDRELVAVCVSSDDRHAAAATADGMVVLVDLKTGREVRTRRSPGGTLVALAFARTGRAIAAWSEGAVRWIGPRADDDDALDLEGPIHALALAPDGKTLVAHHGDGQLNVRDAVAGTLLHALPAGIPPRALALSADGRTIALLEPDALALRRSPTGEVLARVSLPGGAREGARPRLAFAPDGRSLVLADDERAHLIDVEKATAIPLDARLFAFAPAGGLIATAGEGFAARPSRLSREQDGGPIAPGSAPLPGHGDAIQTLAFASGGALLASQGGDGSVRLWDAERGQERQVLAPGSGAPAGIGYLADGELIAWTATPLQVEVHDVASGKAVARLSLEDDRPPPPAPPAPLIDLPAVEPSVADGAVAFHARVLFPDLMALPGALLAGARRLAGEVAPPPARPPCALAGKVDRIALASNRRVRAWEIRAGSRVATIDATAAVTALALSADGRTLAVGAADGSIACHELPAPGAAGAAAGAWRVVPSVFAIVGLAVAPGKVAWIAADGKAGTQDSRGGSSGAFATGHDRGVRACALSPDGRLFATGSVRGALVHDTGTGKLVQTLRGHEGEVRALAFAPDGRRLASGGADSTILLWGLR